MQPLLNNFDPVVFLGIDQSKFSSSVELSSLKNSLGIKMGEYVMLQLSQSLSENQLHKLLKAKSDQETMDLLKFYFPDLDIRIKQELENFKNDFQQTSF